MAYKEKTCPKCQAKHNKRGEFCSRSCGNTRKHTAETKKKIGEASRAWLTSGTDEAEVAKHNYISKRNNGEIDPIAPQKPIDLGHGRFVQDGDLWEEIAK